MAMPGPIWCNDYYYDTNDHDFNANEMCCTCGGGNGNINCEQEPEPEKEFINKEAPEGIEVAEFDGLNISEEMS